MKNLRKFKNIFRNEKGQGATEYILLVAVIVAVVVAFGPKLKSILDGQIGKIESSASKLE